MLEIALLKVRHQHESNAKKMLPYIKECDVFGPEATLGKMSERDVQEREKLFEESLSTFSLTHFRRKIEESKQLQKGVAPGEAAFYAKAIEYAFRSKIPLWFAERYSDEDNAWLAGREEERQIQRRTTFNILLKGEIAGFIELLTQDIIERQKDAAFRDQRIAANIEAAEPRIRERYPMLARQDPLRYTLFLGGAHMPERHTNIIHVKDLVDPSDLILRANRAYAMNKPYEGIERDLLAIGLISLGLMGYRAPSEEQLKTMTFGELTAVVRAIAKNPYPR
jgi:hypothetical protein